MRSRSLPLVPAALVVAAGMMTEITGYRTLPVREAGGTVKPAESGGME